jgi:hypothetical protein
MARAFATNQEISGTTSVAKNQTLITMAGWIRRATAGSAQNFGFHVSEAHRLAITHLSDNNLYIPINNGVGNPYAFFANNVTGWHHYAFKFDGSQTGNSNRLKAFGDGVNKTLSFVGTIPSSTSNNSQIETFSIGRMQYNSTWSIGDFAEIGIWHAILTDEEILSLSKGMTCNKVRPQSLVTYIPLVRNIQDLARGMTLTDTNSTVANHPRVYA